MLEVGVDMPKRDVGFRVKEVGLQRCAWDLWDIEFGVWYASFRVEGLGIWPQAGQKLV